MYCSHLSLTNFRNYVRLELDLSPGITVLQGDNAQGKTNLLEAIYFLATIKSPRAGSDRELIHWLALESGLPAARVAAEVHCLVGVLNVEVGMALHEEVAELGDSTATTSLVKRIRVNGVSQRALDYLGRVNVVMFSPQDLDLVGGQPALRRRYLDITISQVEPRYIRALQQYNRVLVQRNHLLRMIRDGHARTDQLAFWDEQLIESGAVVVAYRRRLVAELDGLAQAVHRRLAGVPERLYLRYVSNLGGHCQLSLSECALQGGAPDADEIAAVASAFQSELKGLQEREIAAGMSLIGPHRDDLQFLLGRNDVAIYGSRGQQRTVALALKLAEAAYLRERTREHPILLLDDVFSELDAQRRRHILASIEPGQQVLVTTTDLERLEADILNRAEVFRIEQGRVGRIAKTLAGRSGS